MQVLARDVSLAEQPGRSSIQNVLPGRVDAIGDDAHPGVALVRVQVGEAIGVSRATAQRHLVRLAEQDMVTVSLRYGSAGRPEHLYAAPA